MPIADAQRSTLLRRRAVQDPGDLHQVALVVAMQCIQLRRHEECFERQGPWPAHPRLKQRCQHRKDARLDDDLPCDLQVGLPGGPAAGAYGDDDSDRPKLVALAQQRASERTGVVFGNDATVMVGATPKWFAPDSKPQIPVLISPCSWGPPAREGGSGRDREG